MMFPVSFLLSLRGGRLEGRRAASGERLVAGASSVLPGIMCSHSLYPSGRPRRPSRWGLATARRRPADLSVRFRRTLGLSLVSFPLSHSLILSLHALPGSAMRREASG